MSRTMSKHGLAAALAAGAGAAAIGVLIRPAVGAEARAKPLNPQNKALQAANRLEFGPRPGDVEAIRKMGVERWIAQQLHPERIDDSAADADLKGLTSLDMTPQALMEAYRGDQMQNRALATARLAAQAARNSGDATTNAPSVTETGKPGMTPPGMGMERPRLVSVEGLGELDDAKVVRAVESKRQLQEILVDFWSNHFNLDVKKGPVPSLKIADERDVIRPNVLGTFRDLLEASAKSPAMLFYLDNASSTRNFDDPSTAPPRGMAGGGFRAETFGMGRPGALAHWPAAGIAANGRGIGAPAPGVGQPRAAQRPRRGGLNENYAREVMELHTLGVNGGYTQKDVTEVARCFTGWSLNPQTGQFRFYPPRHDYGEKTVLGHTIAAGHGIADGEAVLDILAASPATAHHLSYQLCQRFVADTPPAGLVDRAANTYLKTHGDLRQVVRTVITSREFFSSTAFQSKTKSPFEYAVSAVRALGGTIAAPDPSDPIGRLRLLADGASSANRGGGRARFGRQRPSLVQQIAIMGQPLFSHEAPTGYPEDSRQWVSSGALLARFNFAQALVAGSVAQVSVAPQSLAASAAPNALIDTMAKAMLGAPLSQATSAAIAGQLGDSLDPVKAAGLVLGSPEFQRR